MPLPDPIIEVLAVFRPLFTAPTWRKLMILLTGTLLAHGRRTVAAALRATGLSQASNWSLFHQVLNRARWSPLAVSRQLLLLIVETFVPAGAWVDLVIDETLERRWGSKIRKRGNYRDSALSSKERSVSSPGLRWIVLAVVVTLPWTRQRWALPFLCVLATTPEVSARLGKRHKTIAMWAHQMLSLVRRWLPDRSIKLLGDSAYSVLELGVYAQHQHVTLITTGRLDAVLHDPPPERKEHTMGRPRVVGERLPSLEQVLQNAETAWQKLTLDWYSQGERPVDFCTGSALWYRTGSAPLPLRWVLTRDPQGKRPPKAIFCTDPTQTAEEIIKDFMKRWSLEVTFEEGRAHLGIETQRQWSDQAIERSTPVLFGLYSLVTLFGQALHPDGQLLIAQAAWYRKHTATFCDVLALIRRHLWDLQTFPTSPTDPGAVLVPARRLSASHGWSVIELEMYKVKLRRCAET
ncbi:IS701 family transposase [Ktedonosporobacter rubrisoli]|nr:transposase [Ktedonosporobacter rubrisoli]